ncbi:MAG TPA: ISNCY family transposase, partial [Arsenophonus nasoniae]
LSYNYYTDNQVITMFNYLIQEGNAQKPMEFITEIAKQSEKHEGALMTIAQALRQEGRQEGIQEGMQKAKIELAKQFLSNGADRHMVKISTGLSDEELNKIQNNIITKKS